MTTAKCTLSATAQKEATMSVSGAAVGSMWASAMAADVRETVKRENNIFCTFRKRFA